MIEEVINSIGKNVLEGYGSFMSLLPTFAQNFINLFLIVLLIVLYAIFVWKFYRFIATKNILELDLRKYNRSSHPVFEKLTAGSLYFLEYIVILPFLIFFWFSIFTIFLILLTENITVSTLLIISATIISAIRMTSYYNEDLSKDLAKLVPFTLLAVSFLNPGFFSIERILNHFSELASLFGSIPDYLLFIIIIEIVLRFFDFIFSLFGLSDEQEVIEKK